MRSLVRIALRAAKTTEQATTEAHEEASALQQNLRAQQAELTQATARAESGR